ncbi:F-box protein At3g49450-like [Lycium barbarum]|uniref:F-box protein At3g49450-like n=1 Tax=Lycium barbarum TaxID=112863 RepID=UPI00293E222C|nr:F-box protein At3g49450-like [Lycium barbarum]
METSIKRRKCTEEKGNIATSEFDKLTADLITSIFVRCPVKTLSTLRCVSKSWNDLIVSPPFYSHHLKQSMENAPQLLVMDRYLLGATKCRLRFVSVGTEVEEGENNELYNDTFPPLFWCSWLVCYGLVCISAGDRRIFLCNPAMQQVRQLPKCSRTALPPRSEHFGFGYLHSKNEYKVVHFFYGRPASRRSRYPGLAQLRCEVFTINGVGGISNSRWKEIAEMPLYHPYLTGLLVNECMYWLAGVRLDAKPNRIFSFDFENEKFLTISQPSSFKTLSNLKCWI